MDELSKTIAAMFEGCIDIHVHASPDTTPRRFDIIELATAARDAGMRGFVFKSHEYPTTPSAYVISKLVPGIEVFGGLVLNDGVGGLNPHAVEIAAKTGVKKIWMPTFSSHYWATTRLGKASGIRVIDENSKLKPVIHDILDIVQQYDIALASGHLSLEEDIVLVPEARRRNIRTVITHADGWIPVENQKDFAKQGALIEHAFVHCLPRMGPLAAMIPDVPVARMAEAAKADGPESCILSSDLGQAFNPAPPEGLRMFAVQMFQSGVPEKDVERMVKKNPATLLGV